MDGDAEFDARIGEEGGFDARDAELLRSIDEHGSLNRATDALGRSFAHAQRRIVELEDAFGTLVERRRGGSDGGGSELTDTARELLAEFERLRAEFTGVAEVERTVLAGTVVDRHGELATVETEAGTVRALVPGDTEEVEVVVRADAVTLHAPDDTPEPAGTSARNRFRGTVARIDRGEAVALVGIDAGAGTELGALVTLASVVKLDLSPGNEVVASFKATATRAIEG